MLQSSVKSFYEHALKNQISTEENLTGSVTQDFQNILNHIKNGNGLRAIDLGYGYGNYSIVLAQKGFQVTAVDYVNQNYLKRRLQNIEFNGLITVIEEDLNKFTTKETFDVVVSKDVFHFLSKSKVEEFIHRLVKQTKEGGWHYLVIFTDIQRKSEDGHQIVLQNEVQLTTDDLIHLVHNAYRHWKVGVKVEAYREKDRSGKENSFYFQANRVTIVAHNQCERSTV